MRSLQAFFSRLSRRGPVWFGTADAIRCPRCAPTFWRVCHRSQMVVRCLATCGRPASVRTMFDRRIAEEPIMSQAEISLAVLEQLRKFDTPTICNVLELFDAMPRTSGYMDARITACYPQLP